MDVILSRQMLSGRAPGLVLLPANQLAIGATKVTNISRLVGATKPRLWYVPPGPVGYLPFKCVNFSF